MEEQKQVSVSEVFEAIKNMEANMQKEIGDIKSQMVTKDVFESSINDLAHSLNFVTQHAATEVQLIESEARIRKEIDFMHYDLPSKDFVTNKVAELRGSFVEAFKNNDAKANKLSEILMQRKVINEIDNNEVASMVPFPRPKMI